MKICSVCRVEKPVNEFFVDRSRPSGRTYACKVCHTARTTAPHALAKRRERARTLEGRRAWFEGHLRMHYGIDFTEWSQLLVSQSGRCAVCTTPLTKKVCVDHCHETGRVRGLLCNGCNRAEGMLNSDPERAHALWVYMSTHAIETREVGA